MIGLIGVPDCREMRLESNGNRGYMIRAPGLIGILSDVSWIRFVCVVGIGDCHAVAASLCPADEMCDFDMESMSS